jgi:predicted nuclease of restriction endonuclease-like (RecB) superfamily
MKVNKTAPRKNRALARKGGSGPAVAKLATEIRDLIETARRHVSVTANLALVNLYWNIGRIITQDLQRNKTRAEYGTTLLRELATVLMQEYGKGYSRANLQDMRRFFESFEICQTVSGKSSSLTVLQPVAGESTATGTYEPLANESQIVQTLSGQSQAKQICQTPSGKLVRRKTLQTTSAESAVHPICSTVSNESQIPQTVSGESCERLLIDFHEHFRLGWSHYRLLLSQSDPRCRKFYFEQAAEQRWTVRELRRQIDRGLFERVALSRNTARLVAQEKRAGPTETVRYEGIFKDPYILDFLGLKGAYSEKDLEAAIVRNLEQFLTELGTDFCFIGRQYAMRIDDDDYSLDLLFYHRGLRCLVAIDLKIGTFTAADKGQMDLYLAWLKERDRREGENEPVGLILCTSARRQHVELLLRHGPHRMKVAEYLTRLPDKRLLEERLKIYGRLLKDRDGARAAETDQ